MCSSSEESAGIAYDREFSTVKSWGVKICKFYKEIRLDFIRMKMNLMKN